MDTQIITPAHAISFTPTTITGAAPAAAEQSHTPPAHISSSRATLQSHTPAEPHSRTEPQNNTTARQQQATKGHTIDHPTDRA
ncbi:hypothetical protein LOK49_LG07G02547 [Camellia lanceoleosa]|uniref:Uncharacterized protein n=1 Tax=Camellia lanceoleosa TaxID=1840588 RepID=A0ACC0H549_9ERIC|nr:hypothetical protein LOK49_LG07G02547 [Camellia lanceoleosa]